MKVSFGRFIRDLESDWAPQLAPSTWRTVKADLERLNTYASNGIGSVSRRVIDTMQSDLVGQLAGQTIRRIVRSCRAAFNKAVDWGYMEDNPFKGVRMVRAPRRPVRTATPEQIDALAGTCTRALDRAILWLALDGGLRAKEISCLHVDDINLRTGVILIRNRPGQYTKNKEDRTVAVLNPAHVRDLKQVKRDAREQKVKYPFYDRNPHSVSNRYSVLAKRAGIGITLHELRKTCITDMANAKVMPQTLREYAGHQRIETTLEYYTEIQLESLLDARRKADDKYRNTP